MEQFRAEVAAIMGGGTPAPTPIPSQDNQNRPTLQRGARGDLVKRVQRAVGVPDDGIFGSGTEAAVRQFQRSNELVPDGIVGPATWAVIP